MAIITIPPENDEALFSGFANLQGYQEQINEYREEGMTMIPNPQSKQEFLAKYIEDWLKSITAQELVKQQTAQVISQVQQQVSEDMQDSIIVTVE